MTQIHSLTSARWSEVWIFIRNRTRLLLKCSRKVAMRTRLWGTGNCHSWRVSIHTLPRKGPRRSVTVATLSNWMSRKISGPSPSKRTRMLRKQTRWRTCRSRKWRHSPTSSQRRPASRVVTHSKSRWTPAVSWQASLACVLACSRMNSRWRLRKGLTRKYSWSTQIETRVQSSRWLQQVLLIELQRKLSVLNLQDR